MFSVNTMPMSTIVPIAIAIPPSAMMFASTPVSFIATSASSTPRGSTALITSELRMLRSITRTTSTVIRISWKSAVDSVSMVSCTSCERS